VCNPYCQVPIPVLNRVTHYNYNDIKNPKFLKLRKWIQIDKVYWYVLSENPNAIHILEKNLNKVDWYELSKNHNAASAGSQRASYFKR
jgi:hypothetical protein